MQGQIIVNQTQSKVLARAICTAISEYIQANLEEYQKFTAESECEKDSEIEGSH